MEPRIVDKQGNTIKLTSFQKDALYAKAKTLREEVRGSLCTKSEARNPTAKNVDKMISSEFRNSPKMEEYRKTMQAIGADPGDSSIEKLRRE